MTLRELINSRDIFFFSRIHRSVVYVSIKKKVGTKFTT
jgi:hypothetical protein